MCVHAQMHGSHDDRHATHARPRETDLHQTPFSPTTHNSDEDRDRSIARHVMGVHMNANAPQGLRAQQVRAVIWW